MVAVFFALAAFTLLLVPLAPKLLRVRIRILKWLSWDWAVRLLEDHFDRWVLLVRIILLGITGVLLFLGWQELSS